MVYVFTVAILAQGATSMSAAPHSSKNPFVTKDTKGGYRRFCVEHEIKDLMSKEHQMMLLRRLDGLTKPQAKAMLKKRAEAIQQQKTVNPHDINVLWIAWLKGDERNAL